MRLATTIVFAALCAITSCTITSITQAQLITDFVLNGNGPESNAELIESSAIGSSGGTITYKISGLDIAGDGSFNDSTTLVFELSLTGADDVTKGFKIDIPSNDGDNDNGHVGALGVDGNDSSFINHDSEAITFRFGQGSVEMGNGGAGTATFMGFNQVRFDDLDSGSEQAHLSGTDGDGYVNDDLMFGLTTKFTVGGVTGGSTVSELKNGKDSGFRVRDFQAKFKFTTTGVPEPTSFLMFSICLAGSLKRRRAA